MSNEQVTMNISITVSKDEAEEILRDGVSAIPPAKMQEMLLQTLERYIMSNGDKIFYHNESHYRRPSEITRTLMDNIVPNDKLVEFSTKMLTYLDENYDRLVKEAMLLHIVDNTRSNLDVVLANVIRNHTTTAIEAYFGKIE